MPKPKTDPLPQRGFGVEIECFHTGPYDTEALAQTLRALGLNAIANRYADGRHWVVSYELITAYTSGFEIKSPILHGERGLAELQQVMAALVAHGCYVTAAAGLHVHMSRADLSPAQLANWAWAYARFEAQIDEIVAAGRRGPAAYNRSNLQYYRDRANSVAPDAAAAFARNGSPKYATESVASRLGVKGYRFAVRDDKGDGTVELRQHQGCLNGARAAHWVRLMLHLAEAAKDDGASLATPDASEAAFADFLAYTGAPATTANYWRMQRRMLRNKGPTGMELTQPCRACAPRLRQLEAA